MKQLRSNILLIITAFIWGSAFVAQDVASEIVSPFAFNSLRSYVGGIFLLPIIWIFDKIDKKNNKVYIGTRRDLIIGGIICGTVLAIASIFQQLGIGSPDVTSGKAGFITALYILIVPLFGIFMRKKMGLKSWISVLLGVVGMYFLCLSKGEFSVSKGDIYLIICAVCFSVHILVIDHFSPFVNCIKMSCIQFFTCAIINMVFMLIFTPTSIDVILSVWFPIIYAGVFSSGIAYTLQIVAQKDTNPVVASLLMSLESVFALVCGWFLLDQVMSPRELCGCAFVFIGIILSQLPKITVKKH